MPPILEFRGLDLQSRYTSPDSGLIFEITRGFLAIPEARGTDILIPSRTGRDSSNRVADHLPIVLEGWVLGATVAEWRAETDALLAVLDEAGNDPGALIAREPYLGLIGTATIYARVKNSIAGPLIAGMVQTWSIELESLDPYWAFS
jgi:hypothetical protein